ncbi:MAG: hypothetical protein D6160_19165 [Ketobacter sp.]|nr:MAG: hypothetical protein D6160_19165 [Ketobacter sp.]
MSTELLVTLQVILVLVIAVVILLLMLRRQKKTIAYLTSILTTVKEDISGDSLDHHLQLELDDTTAHCSTETIAFQADYKPEDMAISIRYAALQGELSLLQEYAASTNPPWREKIKSYNTFAIQLSEGIEARLDAARTLLSEVHAEEINTKNAIIETLSKQKHALDEQLASLKPLSEMIGEITDESDSRHDLELKLYKALLALCENVEHSEKLREVVFLLHESFHTSQLQNEAAETTTTESQNNTEMLNNIIDKQNESISELRAQIKSLQSKIPGDELTQLVEDSQNSDLETDQDTKD